MKRGSRWRIGCPTFFIHSTPKIFGLACLFFLKPSRPALTVSRPSISYFQLKLIARVIEAPQSFDIVAAYSAVGIVVQAGAA